MRRKAEILKEKPASLCHTECRRGQKLGNDNIRHSTAAFPSLYTNDLLLSLKYCKTNTHKVMCSEFLFFRQIVMSYAKRLSYM